MGSLNTLINTRTTMDSLEKFGINICSIGGFVKNATVCPFVVKVMGDILLPVVSNSLLSSDYFCSSFLQVCDSP
jgi:hypothetical protein